MTRLFRKLSIRNKLILLNMIACTGAIVVACAGFGFYDIAGARKALAEATNTHAEIVCRNSTAALTFGDQTDATNTLASLRAERQIDAAAIFNTDGQPLATYVRDEALRPSLPTSPVSEGMPQFKNGYLEVSRPVFLDGRRIGTVYLRAGLQQLHANISHYLLILLAVVIAASITGLLLVWRIQQVLSDPILHLAEIARQFSTTRDYSVRAIRVTDDEIGVLTDDLNGMLEQMQLRDAEVAQHRDQLEEQVAQRTRQLTQVNEQLSAERDRAEAMSRAKSAFLANMSHEIRTPMTAIVGYADLMLEPDQTISDRQDCLQVIRRNGRHLLDLINDILDISKIEAGKMNVALVPTNLPELLADLISLLRPRAAAKGLPFTLEAQGAVPSRITTDPLRLRQVLMNLLGNAIKFTSTGDIRLRVMLEHTGAGKPVLRFDVCDTGLGISDEQMPRLFQAFSQADDSMTRRFGGTGLGLVISQRLTNLLGGEITVSSKFGQGSTFTVRVDPGALEGVELIEGLTEAILPRPTLYATGNGRVTLRGRILLVEDGPDNQRLISLHLRKAGAAVDIAENGRVGIEKFVHAADAGRPYDLVLMDMQMPELDGYGAASELRARGVKTPIVALTAHAMADDRAKCLAAGCTDYLTKPIEKQLLLETIASYVSPASLQAMRQGVAESPEAPGVPQGMLRSSFAGDPDMKEVIAEFVSQLPVHVKRLVDLTERQELNELRRFVHQLKGAGGGYGFAPITKHAAAVEQRIKAGEALDKVAAELDALVSLIRSVDGYEPMRESTAASPAKS